MSIQARSLGFAYGAEQALSGVSFSVAPGQLVAVLGPNGAGKSTLFGCILGFLPRYTGSITIAGNEARTLKPRALASLVAYIPQSAPAAFGYTVMDMVLMGRTHALSPIAVPGGGEREKALAALGQLDIAQLARRPFNAISGGERQLTLIARALAQRSRILLLDEPTSSLDFGNSYRVMRCLRSLADSGYGVLFSTHDPQQALSFADSVLALKSGALEAYGPAGDVLTAELIHALYGVDAHIRDGILIPPVERRR